MRKTHLSFKKKPLVGLYVLWVTAVLANVTNGGDRMVNSAMANNANNKNRVVLNEVSLPNPDVRITDVTAFVNEKNAVKSIDGITATRWGHSKKSEIWIQYELSKSVELDHVKFKIRDAQHDIPVEILVGDDEDDLKQVYKAQTTAEEGGRGTEPDGTKWMKAEFEPTRGRHVRIVLHEGRYQGAHGKQLWLWEVRLGDLEWPDAYAHMTFPKASDLQALIDKVPPHTTVVCDPERTITVTEKPITIDKPLKLIGLRAELANGLAKTPLLLVQADHVTVKDFWLSGNKGSVSGKASLLRIEGNHFNVDNGYVEDASRHGIVVTTRDGSDDDRYDGMVRNISARNINRDGVSLEGDPGVVRDILVESVEATNSRDRGAVEVCDGSKNIILRKIYAENCWYAVDVQDHNRPNTPNINITIENIRVKNCDYAIKTGNSAKNEHRELTIRNVTREDDKAILQISNTKGVTLDNIRIPDEDIHIKNCSNVTRQ